MSAGGDVADCYAVACGVNDEIDWPPPWCEPCKDRPRRCEDCDGSSGWCECPDCPALYKETP